MDFLRKLVERLQRPRLRRDRSVVEQIHQRALQLSGEPDAKAWSGASQLDEVLRLLDVAAARRPDRHQVTDRAPDPGMQGRQPALAASRPTDAPPVVHGLARVADWLAAAKTTADEQARPWVERMERDVVKLLSDAEAVLVDVGGEVDLEVHEVVDIAPPGAGDVSGHVARTVQPGITWHGVRVRPQRVVVFDRREHDG